jgi:hypothetical protein
MLEFLKEAIFEVSYYAILLLLFFSFLFLFWKGFKNKNFLLDKKNIFTKKENLTPEETLYIEEGLLADGKFHLPIEKVLYLVRHWNHHNFFSSEDGKVKVEILQKNTNNKQDEFKNKLIKEIKSKENEIEKDTENSKKALQNKELNFNTMSVALDDNGMLICYQDKGYTVFNEDGQIAKTVIYEKEKAKEIKEINQEKAKEIKEIKEILNETSFNESEEYDNPIDILPPLIDAKSLAKALMDSEEKNTSNENIKKYFYHTLYSFEDFELFFSSEFCRETKEYIKNIEKFLIFLFQHQNVFFGKDGKVYVSINAFLEAIAFTIKQRDREKFYTSLFCPKTKKLINENFNNCIDKFYSKVKIITKKELFVFYKIGDKKQFILKKGISVDSLNSKFSQDFLLIKVPQEMSAAIKEREKLNKITVLANSLSEISTKFIAGEIVNINSEELKQTINTRKGEQDD